MSLLQDRKFSGCVFCIVGYSISFAVDEPRTDFPAGIVDSWRV